MPIAMDLPGMFLAGSAIAFASRERIAAAGVAGESRYVRSALAFGIIYGLSVAFLCFWREDWMWSYLVEPPLPTMIWYLVFWALLAISAWGGAIATQRAVRVGRRRRALAILLGSGLVLAAVWLALLDSYLHVGTRAEYFAFDAYGLADSHLTRRVIFIGIGVNALVLLGVMAINRWLDRRAVRGMG